MQHLGEVRCGRGAVSGGGVKVEEVWHLIWWAEEVLNLGEVQGRRKYRIKTGGGAVKLQSVQDHGNMQEWGCGKGGAASCEGNMRGKCKGGDER